MSETTQHTPGPWHIEPFFWDEDFTHIGCLVAVTSPGFNSKPGEQTFTVGRSKDDQISVDQKANARLIAAAPDLLAALKMIVAVAETAGWNPVAPDGVTRYLDDARAAIAKATPPEADSTGAH